MRGFHFHFLKAKKEKEKNDAIREDLFSLPIEAKNF